MRKIPLGIVVLLVLLDLLPTQSNAQAAVTDFASLQQAVATANAQGYGDIQLPPGFLVVPSEIDVSAGVQIHGYGPNQSILWWSGGNQPGASVIKVQSSNGQPLVGAHFRDFQIDGNDNYTLGQGPGYGLRLVGVYESLFENIKIIAVGGQCLRAEPNGNFNTNHNHFQRIDTQFCDQAIWLGSPNSSYVADVCCNTFTQIVGAFGLPGSTKPGMYIGQADANVFTYLQMWRWQGTGLGVELDATQPYHGSNIFTDLSASSGGLWAHGSNGYDTVFEYQMSNSEPPPMINQGGRLTWTNDNGPNAQSVGWHLVGQLFQNGK